MRREEVHDIRTGRARSRRHKICSRAVPTWSMSSRRRYLPNNDTDPGVSLMMGTKPSFTRRTTDSIELGSVR
jgi:hypothetical protein